VITGVHALVYSREAEKVRAFFRDVLGMRSVDAGQGWLIFALPPAELAVHPDEGETRAALYLMCDDVHGTMRALEAKGVRFVHPVADRGWGLVTALRLPDGSDLGLYQPKHPTAIRGAG
jgi:catechol 2,3-dioxygenase-like lactoylglutathione lyase family enzyme